MCASFIAAMDDHLCLIPMLICVSLFMDIVALIKAVLQLANFVLHNLTQLEPHIMKKGGSSPY